MKYSEERTQLVNIIDELRRWGLLDCGGGAIIHSHTAYSRAFAALGRQVPNCLNTVDTLGVVPCLAANDAEVKAAYRASPIPFDIPEGVVQRPDVLAVNVLHLIPELKQKMLTRAGELNRHGLAFTIYRHGVFAFARNLDEAFDNLNRVESGARTAIHLATLMGGLDRVSTNPLYPDHEGITQ